MPTPARSLLMLTIASLLLPGAAAAKAGVAPFETMVREAGSIVVLEILSSRPERPAEANAQCKDTVATVKVERVIVGGRERIDEIRVPCGYPCAVVQSPPGRYLVFLKNREGLPTSSNWHLSLLPLTGTQVRWYEEDVRNHEARPLNQAIERILRVRAGKESPSR